MVRMFNPPPRFEADVDPAAIGTRLRALQPKASDTPDVAVIVPVNAQGDLENVLRLLRDLADYAGPHTVDTVLVVNNYPEGAPPKQVEQYRELGARVVSIPNVRRPGEAVGFSARIPGIRATEAPYAVLFDADCRVPDVTQLLNWYVDQFRQGAQAAYTHVAYYDYADTVSIRTRFAMHHVSRWVKRNVLGIPTSRGSNYAVRRDAMLDLYERQVLADEMNVGPTFKRYKGLVAYSGRRSHLVFTSGRMFRPGWSRIPRYFMYRLRYNLRVLPVRQGVAQHTGRENDPVRQYVDNKPRRGALGERRDALG